MVGIKRVVRTTKSISYTVQPVESQRKQTTMVVAIGLGTAVMIDCLYVGLIWLILKEVVTHLHVNNTDLKIYGLFIVTDHDIS